MWDQVDPRRGAVAPTAVRAAGAAHFAGCAAAAAVIHKHKRQRHAQTRDAVYAAATARASFGRAFTDRRSRTVRRIGALIASGIRLRIEPPILPRSRLPLRQPLRRPLRRRLRLRIFSRLPISRPILQRPALIELRPAAGRRVRPVPSTGRPMRCAAAGTPRA